MCGLELGPDVELGWLYIAVAARDSCSLYPSELATCAMCPEPLPRRGCPGAWDVVEGVKAHIPWILISLQFDGFENGARARLWPEVQLMMREGGPGSLAVGGLCGGPGYSSTCFTMALAG